MEYELGDGLPTTLDPARIKEVLGLPKSNERLLGEALEKGRSPLWTQTGDTGDFYERLHQLYSTRAGRQVYQKARAAFEEGKVNRVGRANLVGQLIQRCLTALAIPGEKPEGVADDGEVWKQFARNKEWQLLAEYVWACAIEHDSPQEIAEALAEYPELKEHLQDVCTGMSSSGPIVPGTPHALVEQLAGIVGSLQAEPLDRGQLARAEQIVSALTQACDEREQQQSAAAELEKLVDEWEAGREEPVIDVVAERLTVLRHGMSKMLLNVEEANDVLSFLGEADGLERRIRVGRALAREALEVDDFERLRGLTDDLLDRERQRDAALSSADKLLELTDVAGARITLPTDDESGDACNSPLLEADPLTARAAEEAPETTAGRSTDDPDPQEDVENDASVGEDGSFAVTDSDTGDRQEASTESEAVPGGSASEEVVDAEADFQNHGGEVTGAPNGDDVGNRSAETAIVSALVAGRFGVAYHLAGSNQTTLPSRNAILLGACSHVSDLTVPVDAELHVAAADLQDELAANVPTVREVRPDYLTFIAAGALVPAQLAPGGTVAQLVLDVEAQLQGCPSLNALLKVAAEVSITGVHLPLEVLQGGEVTSGDEWSAAMAEFRQEVESWLEHEKGGTTPFAAATKVWRRILSDVRPEPANRLGAMFAAMADGHRLNVDLVENTARYWQSNGDQEIDQADRLIRTSSTKRIEGKSRQVLRKKLAAATAFAARWRSLLDARPTNAEFHQRQAERLRSAVAKHADSAMQEVRRLGGPLHGATSLLLDHYVARFQGEVIASGRRQLADVLHGELLFEPRVTVDAWGEPTDPVDRDILMAVAGSEPVSDFARAMLSRLRNGDFVGGKLALEYLERNAVVSEEALDALHFSFDEERALAERELRDEVSHVRDRVDMAYALGLLPRETSDQLREQVPSVEEASLEDFGRQSEALDRVKNALEEAHERRQRSVSARLGRQKEMSPNAQRRVKEAIQNGSFQVAEDYLDRIEEGVELPSDSDTVETDLDHFFPDFIESYVALQGEAADLIGRFRTFFEGGSPPPGDGFTSLERKSGSDGSRLIDAWLALQNGGIQADDLRVLMELVGFVDTKVSRRSGGNDTSGSRPVALMQSKPVADRDVTPLPSFGSLAAGRYRLFVLRDRASHQAVLTAAGDWQADSTPRIVILCGVLDAGERRLLARAFQSGEYHSTLLLDEALVVYLAALPAHRLRAFFACSSAFSFAEPFDPNVAKVPPELFYGRERERRRLLATTGDTTHLVYGGRRVGKTALLRSIEAEVSEDGPDVRIYLDLKMLGVGIDRPPAELWSRLGNELARRRIIERATSRAETVEERLRTWLRADTERRVLLLLDEADAFLDAERQYDNPRERYPVIGVMKSLMDETSRRFKVVLAGLHDVQRATRDPNTPLAQLDTPVSIGPMLPETDGSVAEDLIRRPLEALGYRFESEESVVRIAAETNYFPALIQQFCKELLKHLRDEGAVDGPPYVIKRDVVDRVFESAATRERIRDLFRWTIELDERFRFLTYLVALEGFEDYESRLEGVTIREIRTKALEHWPDGFQSDDSYEMFEVLLDEMVGLGIFRVVARDGGGQAYAVRTRNLRMLLGNDEEIRRRYEDIRRTKPAPVFSPGQYRKDVGRGGVSSLTASQENRLLAGRANVGLIFGTRLSGIDRVRESIVAVGEIGGRPTKIHDGDMASIHDQLTQLRRTREPGVHVVVTRMEGEFDSDVVRFALDVVRRGATRRIIVPVFVCGPETAWGWLSGDAIRDPVVKDIWLTACAKDFARGWLRHREVPAYTDLELPDAQAGSLWPAVVEVAARSSLKSIREAAKLALNDEILLDVVSLGEELNPIRVLAKYDDTLKSEEILEIAPDAGYELSADDVSTSLDWASRLGVVHVGESGYRLDPAYVEALAR